MLGCGTYHGDELDYVWQKQGGMSAADKNVSTSYGLYWTNFAKHGNPNGVSNGATSGLNTSYGYEVLVMDTVMDTVMATSGLNGMARHAAGRVRGEEEEAGHGVAPAVVWDKYARATDNHIAFDDPIVADAGLLGPICDFWDTLPRQGSYPH